MTKENKTILTVLGEIPGQMIDMPKVLLELLPLHDRFDSQQRRHQRQAMLLLLERMQQDEIIRYDIPVLAKGVFPKVLGDLKKPEYWPQLHRKAKLFAKRIQQ